MPFWVRIPIIVDDPFQFRLALHIEGQWSKSHDFLIGVERNDGDAGLEGDETLTRLRSFRSHAKGGLGKGDAVPRPVRVRHDGEFLLNPRTDMIENWYYLATTTSTNITALRDDVSASVPVATSITLLQQ